MKKIVLAIFLIALVFIIVSYISKTSKPDKIINPPKQTKENVTASVLELFTSQGCSSCPPADRLLGKYAAMENVIALSYHVDYWNRLGWKDPFSSKVFSQRQKEYAEIFKLQGVYTPQLVINGEKEIVGGNEAAIRETLKKERGGESNINLLINEVKTGDDKITINYTVQSDKNSLVLNIALIQNEVTTSIKAGENNGVNLTNYNVVRHFEQVTVSPGETNTAVIDLLKGVDKKNLTVIAFLQNPETYKIYAAAKSSL